MGSGFMIWSITSRDSFISYGLTSNFTLYQYQLSLSYLWAFAKGFPDWNVLFTFGHLENSFSFFRAMLIYWILKYLLSVFLGTTLDTGYYFSFMILF